MTRLPALVALFLPAAALAQAAEPRIELAAQGGDGSGGSGPVAVSGKIVLPPGWRLTVHTLTIRYGESDGTAGLYTLIPVKGSEFSATLRLQTGSYRVWAVIDAKDASGKERQVKSDPRTATVR